MYSDLTEDDDIPFVRQELQRDVAIHCHTSKASELGYEF
jgi:hypothetical protein